MTTVRLARADELVLIADIERSAAQRFVGTHVDWAIEAPLTGIEWMSNWS